MAKRIVGQAAEVEGDACVRMPVGQDGIVLISGKSKYADRQELASCILSAVVDFAQEGVDQDERNGRGWSIAYLVAVAKGLIDSMDLQDLEVTAS